MINSEECAIIGERGIHLWKNGWRISTDWTRAKNI
jgi:hypothetical protein